MSSVKMKKNKKKPKGKPAKQLSKLHLLILREFGEAQILAEESGVSVATISRICHGKSIPSLSVVISLSRAMHIPIHDLIELMGFDLEDVPVGGKEYQKSVDNRVEVGNVTSI